MQFILVEIKQKDLYTIYDTENKGVCCCSAYTLAQLYNAGHKITGFSINSNGKYSINVCGLDGKPRTKKAPIICADETKRSAVTIEKGLDERHYPRIKQERSGDVTDKLQVVQQTTYEVEIAEKQRKSIRVGDIYKFTAQIERNVPPNEFVGVITWVTTYKVTDLSSLIRIVTKEGHSYELNSTQILSVNSCRLSPDVRKLLTAVADACQTIKLLQKQHEQIRMEQQQEEVKLRNKYAPRYEKLNEKIQKQVQQNETTMNKLMLMSGVVEKDYMCKYIKQQYASHLTYHICKRLRQDCGASAAGSFSVGVYYDKKQAVWRFTFSASIEQRTSYMDIRATPYFYEEYDGDLIGYDSKELENVLGKSEYANLKEQYACTLAHNLRGGIFEVTFDASGEVRKGYYAYVYKIVYEFKGKPVMEQAQFKEILQKIFG